MACSQEVLRDVPLFALLDDEELTVLAAQVDLRSFAARQRIWRIGDPGKNAYVIRSGAIEVSVIDDDSQEVVVETSLSGEICGLASMLERTPHQTTAIALRETDCIEVSRDDIVVLLNRKPLAGMDMLTVLGRQLHASHQLVRLRASRNANELIEEKETRGERLADGVARFGGSWTFITTFGVILAIYTTTNVILRGRAWDPYPFILLNLFLSMLAAIQAPVIMMSQNRQDQKDRVRGELDYAVNRRAEAEIQALSRKLSLLNEKLDDVDELIREPGAAATNPAGSD
jgi:CRP/FNR family cyclic AMP-dependent transcriptional regulator